MAGLFAGLLLALTLWMTLAWVTQRAVGNAGWIDVFWTFGTGAAGVVGALAPAPWPWGGRALLVAAMAALWSLRLGLYIALRVASSSREDVRYAQFRKEWGADFQTRMARFVIVQGPIAAVMALAVMVAARNPAPFPALADVGGALLLLASVAGEGVADRQMRRFRARAPHGAICDRGLWSVCRHPNYLFEFLGWCAYPVVALFAGASTPVGVWGWGLLTLPAVALIYWLLVHVSGIPPLEQAMLRSRGAAFAAYQARVPAFFPRLGRRIAS